VEAGESYLRNTVRINQDAGMEFGKPKLSRVKQEMSTEGNI